jgi:RNA polymerase sigma-70 factor (ECF subfamily)
MYRVMRGKNEHSEALSRELAEARFVELYEDNVRDLLAYAQRRIPVADDAADLVAETFLIAWRRLGEVPRGGEARTYLMAFGRSLGSSSSRARRG